jgi:hypothetical protein
MDGAFWGLISRLKRLVPLLMGQSTRAGKADPTGAAMNRTLPISGYERHSPIENFAGRHALCCE